MKDAVSLFTTEKPHGVSNNKLNSSVVYSVLIYFTLEQMIFSLDDYFLAFLGKERSHSSRGAQQHVFYIFSCHLQLWKVSIRVYTGHSQFVSFFF